MLQKTKIKLKICLGGKARERVSLGNQGNPKVLVCAGEFRK
jgi:hypothetical protein